MKNTFRVKTFPPRSNKQYAVVDTDGEEYLLCDDPDRAQEVCDAWNEQEVKNYDECWRVR
jgi:hypothetical protein